MEKDPTCKPATLLETLAVTTSDLYPNIFIRLYILITMPVATATAERSFSVMRSENSCQPCLLRDFQVSRYYMRTRTNSGL